MEAKKHKIVLFFKQTKRTLGADQSVCMKFHNMPFLFSSRFQKDSNSLWSYSRNPSASNLPPCCFVAAGFNCTSSDGLQSLCLCVIRRRRYPSQHTKSDKSAVLWNVLPEQQNNTEESGWEGMCVYKWCSIISREWHLVLVICIL